MGHQVKRRFLFVQKCLLVLGSLCVFLLNDNALADSCKVERDNKDTILSENCVQRPDGKFVVHFCDGKNKCLSDKVQKAIGYKCQKKSPGTPSFCVDVKLFKNSFPVSTTKEYRTRILRALESKSIKPVEVQLGTDREFETFRQAKKAGAESEKGELYLVYSNTNELRAACSGDDHKLAAMMDLKEPPSCDSIGNAISELPPK